MKRKFSKILVAMDGSESSKNAARYATMMAKKNNSELIAIHILTPDGYAQTMAAAALIVCVSCNATRNEIIVIDSVIAPIISMVDLLFLPMLLLLVLMLSESRISFLT